MSITAALAASRSGLSVAGTRGGITSENIANAGRADYVRRSASLDAPSVGGGVAISAIRRDVNGALQARERDDMAAAAYHQTLGDGIALYTDRLAGSGSGHALPARIADLQADIDLLSGSPGDTSAQRAVLSSAETLARDIREAANAAKDAKASARSALTSDMNEANTLLDQIASANVRIGETEAGSSQRATAQDARDAAIDRLSEIVDLDVSPRADGTLDLRVGGGAALLEGTQAHHLSFDDSTGTLSAGEADIDITPGRAGARGISGGSLAANVTLTTRTLPEMSRQLDALAGGLVTAFEAADSTLTAGQAGLFTDEGGAFVAADRDGLASRLAVNDAVRPEAGGDLWRIRDGIEASGPGAASDPTQILAFAASLETAQSFDEADGLGTSARLSDYAATLVADHNVAATEARETASGHAASAAAIATQRSTNEGVNVDTELQDLLSIEQSYAANAQVISALTRMMDTLLEAV